MTHSPGKIEYNCRYFIMTVRTQIHKKKFGTKCFRNLQGTMSHCPLTNTSSLKIAAAYYASSAPCYIDTAREERLRGVLILRAYKFVFIRQAIKLQGTYVHVSLQLKKSFIEL